MSDDGTMSTSARVVAERPFYESFGWAYDMLISTPVEPWVEHVIAELAAHEIGIGSHLLDAGCGTGRYAEALIAHGYRVDLVDASPQLLQLAARRLPGAQLHQVDLCRLDLERSYDAVVCRGVLNDMVTDSDRQAAVDSFADVLRPRGVLVLDVRERQTSRQRYSEAVRTHKEVDTAEGKLQFSTVTTWRDDEIVVQERHELTPPDAPAVVATQEFTMRAWTLDELHERLGGAGLTDIRTTQMTDRGTPDRLICTAIRR